MLLRRSHRLLARVRISGCARTITAGTAQAQAQAHADAVAEPHDVVIVGGGIVGAVLACRLATSPAFDGGRVALIETAPPKPLAAALADSAPPDLRVYAVRQQSIELLRSVAAVPYVSPAVQTLAKEALKSMDRYPLADNVLMGLTAPSAEQPAEEAEVTS